MVAARAGERRRRGSIAFPLPFGFAVVVPERRSHFRRELIAADGTGIRQLRRLGARRFRCGHRILMPDNVREIRRRIAVPAGTGIRHQIACAGVFHAGTFGIIVNVFFLGRRCRIADRRRVCEGTVCNIGAIPAKTNRQRLGNIVYSVDTNKVIRFIPFKITDDIQCILISHERNYKRTDPETSGSPFNVSCIDAGCIRQ